MVEARDELCSAAETIAIECDVPPADRVVWGSADDRAAGVSGDGATACVANTGHGNPPDFEVGGAGADHLAAVGRGIAEADDVFHRGSPGLKRDEARMIIGLPARHRSQREPPSI